MLEYLINITDSNLIVNILQKCEDSNIMLPLNVIPLLDVTNILDVQNTNIMIEFYFKSK